MKLLHTLNILSNIKLSYTLCDETDFFTTFSFLPNNPENLWNACFSEYEELSSIQ